MNKKSLIECERKRFQKIINFRLPHRFMYVGIAISLIALIMMFIRAFAMEGDTEWFKLFLQKILLVGMLLMSISRDKIEDEMTIQLRSQSYMVAFVLGVLYALVMPYIELSVSNVVNNGGEVYKDLGDFQVLLFMLLMQLMFYHNFKRYR